MSAMATTSKSGKTVPPPPLPPGVIRHVPPTPPPPPPKKAKTSMAMASGSSTAQGSQEPWNPEQVTDDPKKKNWWDKGAKGRKKKMRSIEHWLKQNQENFAKMDQNDFVQPGLAEWEYPAYDFREQARKWELLRYFAFLLQMVIKLVKVWVPTRAQIKHYGLGVQTPARTALLIMHTGPLPDMSVVQLKNIKRFLFGRVAKDTENLKAFQEQADEEVANDKKMTTAFWMKDHINDVMIPLVKDGHLPKLNPNLPALQQYDHVWEDNECMLLYG